MFVDTRSFHTRLTRTIVVATAVGAMACDDGEKYQPTPVAGETAPAVPIVPASNTTPVSVGGTGVSTVPTFSTAAEAYKAGRFRDAAEMYKVHVGAKPDDAHGYYMLGLSSWKSGDFNGAKEALDKSIELNPKFAKSYFNQARVLLDMKRGPEAFEMIERGRKIDSTSLDGWRLKARVQSETGDVDGAMQTYRELIATNDADGWGLNNLGLMLLNRNKVDEALGPLARAVQVQPTAPLFQNNLGMALERSGFKVAALQHYEIAVKNDSSFTKAVKNAERLKGILPDTARTPEVDVKELAEKFRQLVKTWK